MKVYNFSKKEQFGLPTLKMVLIHILENTRSDPGLLSSKLAAVLYHSFLKKQPGSALNMKNLLKYWASF